MVNGKGVVEGLHGVDGGQLVGAVIVTVNGVHEGLVEAAELEVKELDGTVELEGAVELDGVV